MHFSGFIKDVMKKDEISTVDFQNRIASSGFEIAELTNNICSNLFQEAELTEVSEDICRQQFEIPGWEYFVKNTIVLNMTPKSQ